MNVALITGSGGLIGSEAAHFFAKKDFKIIGVDNDMRKYFFGREASTAWNVAILKESIEEYQHLNEDIRDAKAMETLFRKYNSDIRIIIHAAAQPSHDWAAQEPFTDFSINANGTLVLLEMTRKYSPEAVFIFISTNKVYGDAPNHLPLVENKKRWELNSSHPYFANGIDESMGIDQNTHSLFGVSKAAADILVQEYGRYFGIKTACFRGGCLTGPNHSGARLHGFLAYLIKCLIAGEHYNVFGYKGKQVRDNIHSYDFVNMLWHFYQNPRPGEVYNAGGSRFSNCSILEAIYACEKITGNKMNWSYTETNRIGDHIWWISDISKFRSHYPGWNYKYTLEDILHQTVDGIIVRL
ncbi:MAG: NAD-dependent epimerase/dehydratase family protein [Desulfobacterales bacterium]|jgi:CDP-paratose 2-epimerase|nr:NAD-dependent epimerase/dehydratase family protein [Desulfobacterales bacterium]MDP6806639.1 NAD-dependent epimerase/dehydratase family protein [Desulfobacterales bacterium]|tara:strand:+ start:20548 stop:21609 length:1062 start_codon:yes stop_codon:yes gene_type:complete